jgi:hypothetical protein
MNVEAELKKCSDGLCPHFCLEVTHFAWYSKPSKIPGGVQKKEEFYQDSLGTRISFSFGRWLNFDI